MLGLSVQIDAQRPIFRSGVDMVPLTVTVTDAAGKYVRSLTDHDFTIFEDGVEQPLSFFASEQVGVDLAVMIDVSASMQPHMPLVRKAARGLVRSLRPHDRATVVAVRNVVGVPQSLTSDLAQVETAINGLTAFGDTALYDGVYVVLKEFARLRVGTADIRKQVLVVLSDGVDTASRLGFDDIKDLAGRVGVNIYVIAMPSSSVPVPRQLMDGKTLQSEHAMRALAQETGARSFFPKVVADLPAIYAEIGTELANQYELAYLPLRPLGDRGYRRVSVRVTNALTRTRSGYYADSKIAVALAAVGSTLAAIVQPPQR